MVSKEIYHIEVYGPSQSRQYVLTGMTFWEMMRYAAKYLLKKGCRILIYAGRKENGIIKFGSPNGMMMRTQGGIYWGSTDGYGFIYPTVKDFATLNRTETRIEAVKMGRRY